MRTELIEYYDGNTLLEGMLVSADKTKGLCPGILVAHDWSGRGGLAENKAKQLAELGYIAFAIDMFGKGISGKTTEEKSKLIEPFVNDRNLLKQRVTAALHTLEKLPGIDRNHIGAIGFCFGGMCVLDLARSGADIAGVVSFHGLLDAAKNAPHVLIKAKVLALHGHDDPMGPPDQVLAFETEMTIAKADWQLNIYGNTKHAFANPMANDPVLGTVYNEKADKRSWIAMKDFFVEVFK